ncbi:RNA-guided pseudouridylation complex pseudouridine synthase subunit Cbf5 [Candidatus Woesearchaeota archaeon]|nr:RNA-guided pseudouridylation complex pseudouridine synthase subunit Cbf5 [Candidatus Woesearchaeota archaeon]
MNKLPFETIKKEVLVRKVAETDLSKGKRPEDRSIEELIKYGIICVNKLAGPTSHQVSDYVKRIFNVKKSGHSGTLDPNVTGVLPVALERATRIVQVLLKAGKEYVCLMHLHGDFKEEEIKKACKNLIGKIKQIPPVKSAVKRVEREREIYYLEVLEINGRNILFRVGCEAGTYIRKLCEQIGKELKSRAHMLQLIRTKAGPFNDKEMYSLQDIKDAYEFWKEGNEELIRKVVKPIEFGVQHLSKVYVFDSAVDKLCHGADLYAGGVSKIESGIKKGDFTAVMTLKGELIFVGESMMGSEEMLKAEKGTAVRTNKVFMERGIY